MAPELLKMSHNVHIAVKGDYINGSVMDINERNDMLLAMPYNCVILSCFASQRLLADDRVVHRLDIWCN